MTNPLSARTKSPACNKINRIKCSVYEAETGCVTQQKEKLRIKLPVYNTLNNVLQK